MVSMSMPAFPRLVHDNLGCLNTWPAAVSAVGPVRVATAQALSRRIDGNIVALGEPQTLTVTADPGVTLTPAQRTANG